MKKRTIRVTAYTLLFSLSYQLLYPLKALALTTGPSQPEVQSFEPVGTTDMVNMFSGDFNYNIPLMDVEGYPINISYHSGISIEQEASWVGLGWNINPGEINRAVRGLPDDFNGETIEKTLHIKEEQNFRIASGANVGSELVGKDLLSGGIGLGWYINYNSYRGVGVGANVNGSVSLFNTVNIGGGIGVGSQTGADVDLNAGVGYSTGNFVEKNAGGGFTASVSAGSGFNSRSGLKDISFSSSGGMTVTRSSEGEKKPKGTRATVNTEGYSTTIPIGMQNYVPVVSNASTMSSFQFQTRLGFEAWTAYPNLYFNAGISSLKYNSDGSKHGYGYLYMENAPENGDAILDFTRDKDGIYNKSLQNLPAGALTYDIYSINGQGTGGMFRPFRNDIGTVYDPLTSASGNGADLLLEFGYGNLFEAGTDVNIYDNINTSGPWNNMKFGGNSPGTLYEKAYFKQAGEFTYNQQTEAASLFYDDPVYLQSNMLRTTGKNGAGGGFPGQMDGKHIYWDGHVIDRTTRANLLTYLTAYEASLPELAQYAQYRDYKDSTAGYYNPAEKKHNRYTNGDLLKAQKDHISEFTQTLADGRRYIYGIPAMTNVSREATFSVNEASANANNGLVTINTGDDGPLNHQGRDNYYMGANTPAYAHSYLLTSVLSSDYVDVMGDGPTDDDMGTFVKFNYNCVDSDYRWRTPYDTTKAQYDPGFWSDLKDGKGSYLQGSRQQWHLRSVESKNYIAEFYISKRDDGEGIAAAVLTGDTKLSGAALYKAPRSNVSSSYKLDSIKLYNKHDRYLNSDNAVPIKTVIFSYSYRLCPGTPNSIHPAESLTNVDGSNYNASANGKLTLERIYIRYGTSDKNLLSPYVFSYNTPNPAYDFASKDRWGNYKQNNPQLTNYEFPYVDQSAGTGDAVTAWNMTDVKLPSGGNIHVTYESDDYAYVQDRRAMQMFQIVGVGNTPKLAHKTSLYEGTETIQDYIYFKRRKDLEVPGLSLKDNYLEGQDILYYNFGMDVTGTGRYDRIKGYANIAEVGYCDGDSNSDYAYIRVKKENVNGKQMHPATLYGLNIARYYLPHLLYPGGEGNSISDIVMGLIGSSGELAHMKKPFVQLLKDGKGRNIQVDKSWVRLQAPGMKKRGGGIRVKKLELQDNWSKLSGNDPSGDASYGKQYDYTIYDGKYGTMSSGVASYEPMIGNDENPFRKPVPWQADAGRWLPATDFFQEEPFGESFFPSPEVGYSSIRVQSIHVNEGRSSQSEDEYLYYTAKDFPISVSYTDKSDPGPKKTRSLRKTVSDESALQGYSIIMNDMHGKPKAINNYVLRKDAGSAYVTHDLITGTRYNYRKDAVGKLSNTVTAMVRKRGTLNTFVVKDVTLGKEMDFTVDSREKYFRSFDRNIATNLNVSLWGILMVPIPSLFYPDKEEIQTFKMQVSTKIIQQYGMVESIETYDHKAKTITQNLIYDGETGGVILSQTSNEFNDNTFELKHPAYMAYDGMGPAYSNTGFEENVDSLVVSPLYNGYIYTNNLDNYAPGDELEVKAGGKQYKLWVIGVGVNNDTVAPPPPVGNIASVSFVPHFQGDHFPAYITVTGTSGAVTKQMTVNYTDGIPVPPCGDAAFATFDLTPNTQYYYSVSGKNNYVLSESFNSGSVGCHFKDIYDNSSGGGGYSARIAAGTNKRCALLVSSRYKYSSNIGGVESYWSTIQTATKAYVKIIRSGRRNNLSAYVQQMAMTQNPYQNDVADLFGPHTGYTGQAYNNLLGISANTFTDVATAYGDYQNILYPNLTSGQIYTYDGLACNELNPYVTGNKGNFRPQAEYVRFANRTYSGHARYDGIFPLTQPFWTFTNTNYMGPCGESHDVLLAQPNVAVPTFWKQVRATTKYDVFGNAIEEMDALGNYSSAQYGYNKQMPLSVASNTRQENFFFDGFEDYLMLMPKNTRGMFVQNIVQPQTQYLQSPFLKMFNGYTSTAAMVRYGQNYFIRTGTSDNGNWTVSNGTSHSGRYSMIAGSTPVNVPIGNQQTDKIGKFLLTPGKKYLLDVWVNPLGTSITGTAQYCTVSVNGNVTQMTPKTGNIESWYLLEATIDVPASASGNATVSFPSGLWIDDIRMFPIDANMKSFVYDPISFKLAAQLDENHFATFYEYDQEGILVRVKKETDRGVMTVSESRRSNAKNP
ncbi:hypothetical protein [Taibaiella soli]|uniref:Fibronectin type-III domain-containing protein n=1 Tax=Taibaiella soli TaxID=1649169 RepID=A0A2W2BEU8_9BACT|nr:hypothetical protein [Taibaiella soli]PZF74799.1 hypothetical protein DN068_00965 [Taibaiella soli]